MLHQFQIARRRALPLSAASLALTLAIGAFSSAGPARAGDSDVIWGLYKMRGQECAQRTPTTTVHGCAGTGSAVTGVVAAPTPTAFQARLRQGRRQNLQ